jgi:cytochrome P450
MAAPGPTAALPPKPKARPDGAGWLARLRLARRDILASQPDRLYGAWVARQRLGLLDSYLVNQPDLVRAILDAPASDFPKAGLVGRALRPLLGRSVFVTGGALWQRQRAMIDPAFAGGRLHAALPRMVAATGAAIDRLRPLAPAGPVEIEFETARLAADIIFRTLFGLPITDRDARDAFDAFRSYQRRQPILSLPALAGLPSLRGRAEARRIRTLLARILDRRGDTGGGDDLAASLLAARDPATGEGFARRDLIDHVAIFFLAGHETSASALSWALVLLALNPDAQDRLAAEAAAAFGPQGPDFASLRHLSFTRAVFHETLRLYPPVPMLLRTATRPLRLRGHLARPGALLVLSPWHLHRHRELWPRPDAFDPDRWADPGPAGHDAFIPFSRGPRVCAGAGFAMMEGVVTLAMLVRAFRFALAGEPPQPVAHLTLRTAAGIPMVIAPRDRA